MEQLNRSIKYQIDRIDEGRKLEIERLDQAYTEIFDLKERIEKLEEAVRRLAGDKVMQQ